MLMLEKQVGKVEVEKLPRAIKDKVDEMARHQDALTAHRQDYVRTRGGPYYGKKIDSKGREVDVDSEILRREKNLEKVMDDLRALISQHKKHAEIAALIEKGATHFHFYPLEKQLHFVKLGKRHAGKEYVPLIGDVRFPI